MATMPITMMESKIPNLLQVKGMEIIPAPITVLMMVITVSDKLDFFIELSRYSSTLPACSSPLSY